MFILNFLVGYNNFDNGFTIKLFPSIKHNSFPFWMPDIIWVVLIKFFFILLNDFGYILSWKNPNKNISLNFIFNANFSFFYFSLLIWYLS